MGCSDGGCEVNRSDELKIGEGCLVVKGNGMVVSVVQEWSRVMIW